MPGNNCYGYIYCTEPTLQKEFFSSSTTRAPRTPAAQNARRDCCLKCYTHFMGIHFFEVCIFSIYHIQILPANHHTPDAPAAHYTRAEGLAMRLYVHLYMPWNKRLYAHIYIIIYCPFYVHLYQLILSFFYAIICTHIDAFFLLILCTPLSSHKKLWAHLFNIKKCTYLYMHIMAIICTL